MKLLLADFILTCNEKFEIILNGGVLFDEKIVDVGSGDELIAKYKDATIWQIYFLFIHFILPPSPTQQPDKQMQVLHHFQIFQSRSHTRRDYVR